MKKLRKFNSIFNDGWLDVDDAKDQVLNSLVDTVNTLIDKVENLTATTLHQKADQISELEGHECIIPIKKTLHTNYINIHTKETEFECVKCKKIVPKNEVKQHLEDWHGEAVYLKVCKECYSNYDDFTDFIEDNYLGSYY